MSIENTQRIIKVIPATQRHFGSNVNNIANKERVCAYARVSTDSEDQLNSYNTQCEYYNNILSNDPNIVYVGLYADEGITGTKMKKRKEFLRMIEDCKNGKITRIITKSVQRFARNTAECLTIARELKDKGVTIKFETSGIDTIDPNAWLVLGIMATIAEEESRTISHNITWAYQKKFERGEYAGSGRIYGYNMKGGNFKIIQNEALVVRKIFDLYLLGNTLRAIKRELEKQEILTPLGRKKWYVTTIHSILTNEKYKGDLLLQKTYKADVLCERKVNDGAKAQYYVKDNHLSIIPKEMFDAVQTELQKREDRKKEDIGIGNYTNDYAFSSIIECGECGSKFRRHSQWSLDHSKKVPIWVCTKHQKHKNECDMKPIKESSLEQGFLEALQVLTSNRKDILTRVRENINTVVNKQDADTLANLLQSLELKQKELVKITTQAAKPNEEEQTKTSQLITEIKDISEKIEMAKKNTDNISIISYRLKEIDKMLKGVYTEFNKDICKNLIEKIIIKDKHTATYIFKCGVALDQTL